MWGVSIHFYKVHVFAISVGSMSIDGLITSFTTVILQMWPKSMVTAMVTGLFTGFRFSDYGRHQSTCFVPVPTTLSGNTVWNFWRVHIAVTLEQKNCNGKVTQTKHFVKHWTTTGCLCMFYITKLLMSERLTNIKALGTTADVWLIKLKSDSTSRNAYLVALRFHWICWQDVLPWLTAVGTCVSYHFARSSWDSSRAEVL